MTFSSVIECFFPQNACRTMREIDKIATIEYNRRVFTSRLHRDDGGVRVDDRRVLPHLYRLRASRL